MTRLKFALQQFVTLLTAMSVGSSPAMAKSKTVDSDFDADRDPASQVDRPPQFVLLAFDGSLNLDMWDETYNFADSISTDDGQGKLRFTYFVSPVYYTSHEHKMEYNTPVAGPGVSCIGWSSTPGDIALRVGRTNRAFEHGHEIGSHANAHCTQTGQSGPKSMQGHPWTFANWDSEFSQFNHLLFDTFQINHVTPIAPGKHGNGFSFTVDDVKGFRAPLLEYTPSLYPVLSKYKFTYDTSQQSSPDYWPQKKPWGGWNIPLADIKVAGTHRPRHGTITCMDYNWYYFHSSGAVVKNLSEDQKNTWYNQVFDSYMYYFKQNYFGNRAPVQIGDHFSKWNGGIYWDALMNFAKKVCSKPEVRCVTMSEFIHWAESQGPKYDSYRHGNFPRLPDDHTIKDIDSPVMAGIRLDSNDNRFEAVVSDADRARVHNLGWKPQILVNMEPTGRSSISREDLMQKASSGNPVFVRAALVNRSGVEMNWQTYRIDNLGTPEETMSTPLEDDTHHADSPEAHSGADADGI